MFQFKRTICNCEQCRLNCKVIPGYLIPSDIFPICNLLGMEKRIFDFSEKYLLASPGAKVIKNGEIFRIKTLVPTRNKMDYCIFFTELSECAIHTISPFGCRYFDCTKTMEECDNISSIGLNSIMQKGVPEASIYSLLWDNLEKKGLISPGPEILRKKFKGENNE
jgi:hypothetical protein